MRLTIDNQEYTLPLQRTINIYQLLYEKMIQDGLQVGLPSGDMLLLSRDSLLRSTLKILMTPIVIPRLRKLYASKGMTLPDPPKHSDLVDFVVLAVLNYIRCVEGGYHVSLTSEDGPDSIKTIKTFTASWSDGQEKPDNSGKAIEEARATS